MAYYPHELLFFNAKRFTYKTPFIKLNEPFTKYHKIFKTAERKKKKIIRLVKFL